MSARQVIFAGKRFLVGASWMPLIGDVPEKQEAHAFAQQTDAALQVRIHDDAHVLYGFIDKASLADIQKVNKEAKKRKEILPKDKAYYSLGAALKSAINNGVFARDSIMLIQDPVDATVVHYVAFQNGMPDGNEVCGDRERVRQRAEQQIGSGNTSIIYSNCGLFPESTRRVDFEQVLSELEIKDALLRNATGAPFDAKKALLLCGAVAAIGFVMADDIRKLVMPPPPPPPPVDYVKLYREELPKLLGEAGPAGRSAVEAVMKLASDLPLRLGGWKTVDMTCNVSGCVVTYMADPDYPATFATFDEAKPAKVTNVQYDAGGKRLVASWGTPEDFANAPRELLPEKLPSDREFLLTDVSFYQRLQRVNTAHSLGPISPFGLPSGAPDGVIPPEILIKRGDFTLTGDAWMLYDLPVPKNVTVSEIHMILNPEAKKTFTIRGYYYVS